MKLELQIGQNIRRLRLESGLSQEALAKSVGATSRHIGRIEHGSISVTVGLLGRIANSLRCPVGWLLETYSKPMPPNLPRGRGRASAAKPEASPASKEQIDPALKDEMETIKRILERDTAGPLTRATEEFVTELINSIGGEGNLTETQRRNIDLAFSLAAAKDAAQSGEGSSDGQGAARRAPDTRTTSPLQPQAESRARRRNR